MKTFQEFLAEAKQPEIEMHGTEVDEMDFGSIGKTLSKYGKGVPDAAPKAVKRSSVHTDYTMTGHKEKKSSTGRVYTKVLSDYDDDAPKAAKATQAPDQVEAPKRGRGRPAGAQNKNGSGVTGKGWSDEAKASMKAKLAANKAAKLAAAAKNESEEQIEELSKETLRSYKSKAEMSDPKDDSQYKARSKGITSAEKKLKTESIGITEEDWADIVEGQSLDAIVEFMMDEEYKSLDELSKKTLGSYVKKAALDIGSKGVDMGTNAANGKHDPKSMVKYVSRIKGINKGTDRLTKEATDPMQRYLAGMTGNIFVK